LKQKLLENWPALNAIAGQRLPDGENDVQLHEAESRLRILPAVLRQQRCERSLIEGVGLEGDEKLLRV